jgi:hypothetical protein
VLIPFSSPRGRIYTLSARRLHGVFKAICAATPAKGIIFLVDPDTLHYMSVATDRAAIAKATTSARFTGSKRHPDGIRSSH